MARFIVPYFGGFIPFGLGGGGTLPPTLWAAIRTHLMAKVPTLTEVYLVKPNALGFGTGRATFPYVVVNPISSVPTELSGNGHWETLRVQFSVLSTDDLEVSSLGVACRKAFDSTEATLTFADGWEMGRYRGMVRLTLEDVKALGAANVYCYMFEMFWIVCDR